MLESKMLTHRYIKNPGVVLPKDKLLNAINRREIEKVKNMLASLNEQEMSQVINFKRYLDRAALYGLFEIVKLLIGYGANVNTANNGSFNVLHYAMGVDESCASARDINTINYLIEKGVNVNHCDYYKKTPLQYACDFNDTKLILILLAAGADISGDHIDFVQTGSDGWGDYDRKSDKKRVELKTFLETKLGSQMPLLVEIGKDKQGKPIYRQAAPDGTPVKSNYEKQQIQLENELIKNNPKTSELVALSMFKNHVSEHGNSLAETLAEWGIAKELSVKDIGCGTQVSIVNNGQGTNGTQLTEIHDKATEQAQAKLAETGPVLRFTG